MRTYCVLNYRMILTRSPYICKTQKERIMLRYLFIFILLAASLLLTASAKGAIIHMIYNVAECHDPKDTNPWEQDNRSITNFPIIIQENNAIHIYSNILLNNMDITIKDSSNNIIQSVFITVVPNQPTAIKIVTTEKGDYKIELRYNQVSLYGYFSIMP